jgi:hypothetical protein
VGKIRFTPTKTEIDIESKLKRADSAPLETAVGGNMRETAGLTQQVASAQDLILEICTRRRTMSPLTVFLSRLIGLYCILASLSMAAHRQATVETVTALIHTPPLLLIAGIIALIAGLAMVVGHNIWSGGALPVIVTLVGWITLIRGLLVLFLPPEAGVGLFVGLHYEQFFYLYLAIPLVLGVYLTYCGFRSAPR